MKSFLGFSSSCRSSNNNNIFVMLSLLGYYYLFVVLLCWQSTSVVVVVEAANGNPIPYFSSENSNDDFVVAGYFPDYRSYINLNNTMEYLTDLIMFSQTPKMDCCLNDHHFNQAREAQAYKKEHYSGSDRLKIWVSIGGAGRSDGFTDMVKQKQSKQTFIDSLIRLCQKERIDGIDFDWEVPQTESEKNQYYHFLTTATKQLHEHNILISVALHPNQFLPPFLYYEVDRIHFMTYDIILPAEKTQSAAAKTTYQHHAAQSNVEQAVNQIIKASGCPPHKILLGIPAYARHEQNPGNVQTFAETIDGMMETNGKDAIEQALQKDGDEYTQQQSSLFKTNKNKKKKKKTVAKWNGYVYETRHGIRNKVEYATSTAKLGGIFFWELGQDKQYPDVPQFASGILLQAAGVARNEYVEKVQAKKQKAEL